MQVQKQVYPNSNNRLELREEGIPLRWLADLVSSCLAEIPENERDTAKVQGYDSLRVTHSHTLSPVEMLQVKRQELEAKLSELRDLLVVPTAENLERARELLK